MQPLVLCCTQTTGTSTRLPSLITVGEPECHHSHQSFLRLLGSPLFVCPFFLSSSVFFQIFFFFSQSFFITLQLQLICSGKLGPSTSLSLCLGRARVSRVRRQGAQTGGGREREQGRQREREGGRERGGERRPQANEWASCRKEAGFACDFLPSVVLCNNHHNTFSPFHTVRLIKKMAGLY